MKPRILITLGAVAMMAVAACGVGGCQLLAWSVAQFAPPPKVKPKFVLPKNSRTLVFVDDMANPVSYEPVKADLADKINAQLTAHKLVKETIAYDRLLDVISNTPGFNKLSVSQVGEKMGAETVIYVEITRFQLRESDSNLWRGQLEVTVRVLDDRGNRLWPLDRPSGMPLTPVDTPSADSSVPGFGADLSKILADKCADQVAKLFYEYEEERP
jgi:hypothetical protein